MPKTFKYKILKQDIKITNDIWGNIIIDYNEENLEAKLNDLGAKGWDLVSSFDINIGHGASKEVVLILKKEEPASGEQSYE